MPKDKKAKAAEKKQRAALKTEKKTAQKEKKAARKPQKNTGGDASDSDDATDLDALLASYAAQQEQFLKVTETVVPSPPSARSSATLLASPSNDNELLLFGGEFYDGALARFYNDLFVYNITRDEWRLVTSPNTPLPRSGHAWTRGGNAGGVYLFGGEFSSPKQGTFYHYNDFWRLDPSSREWAKVEPPGKSKGQQQAPSARSGHRMTYFKNYILLFGGFQDTAQQTKYLNDLWVYDCQNYMWHSPVLPPASQKPEARSSFSFLPHESGAVIYGGYSRVKVATMTRPTKGNRGGAGAQRDVMKPVVHQDAWFLRITPPASEAPPNTPPTVRWERRKRAANAPNPARAGATMAFHRGRGIQFGGVHDVEQSEEGIDSEFFNTLYVWNIDRNRYFPLALRRPRTGKKTGQQTAAAEKAKRGGRGKADEEELLKNLKALEMQHGIDDSAEKWEAETLVEEEQDTEADTKPEKPVLWEMPNPRFNTLLTVSQNDILYMFGGTFEKGDQEFTLDEMYSIDLGKLDGVREIFKRDVEAWQGSEDEDSEEDDEDEDEGSDDDDEEAEVQTPAESVTSDSKDSQQTLVEGKRARRDEAKSTIGGAEPPDPDDGAADEADAPESVLDDGLPDPRPFETLRDFFARTSQQWQAILLGDSSEQGVPPGKSIKEVRKSAFDRAEEKWWDSREVIQRLEEEQEEAGIGEVVSLADRGNETGGAARRR